MNVRVVFLDATDAVLVRRFESVRRPHPLQGDGTLLDGIGAERARLAELRESSDIVIDTSDLNIHQLATLITETFAEAGRAGLQVTLLSFGFKYGLPADADLVADARFLPNPFWIPELRHLNGEDPEVARLRAQPARRPRVHRRLCGGARAGAGRATSARTSDTRRSPSDAPAASTARSPSWRELADAARRSSPAWPSA